MENSCSNKLLCGLKNGLSCVADLANLPCHNKKIGAQAHFLAERGLTAPGAPRYAPSMTQECGSVVTTKAELALRLAYVAEREVGHARNWLGATQRSGIAGADFMPTGPYRGIARVEPIHAARALVAAAGTDNLNRERFTSLRYIKARCEGFVVGSGLLTSVVPLSALAGVSALPQSERMLLKNLSRWRLDDVLCDELLRRAYDKESDIDRIEFYREALFARVVSKSGFVALFLCVESFTLEELRARTVFNARILTSQTLDIFAHGLFRPVELSRAERLRARARREKTAA